MRKRFTQFVFFLLGFLGVLLILELFIQQTHIVDRSYNDVYEDIGRGRRANMPYMMFNEGFSIGRFNKYRYLGPDYPPEKDRSVIRIALLGDSFVEGFQVFNRDHFRSVLEAELSKKLAMPVEVLNFGRSGFDIGDMYAYKESFVEEFAPDYTLLFVANVDFYPQFTDPLRLKVRMSKDSLIIEKGFPRSYIALYNRTKILTQHSSLLNILNNGRKTIKTQGLLPILFEKFYPVRKTQVAASPSNTEKKIPEITAKIFASFDTANTIIINRDVDVLAKEQRELVDSNHLRYIDLKDTLDILVKKGIDPYYWKSTKKRGHWNHKAHEAVGIFLADELAKQIDE
jgi:lysophospholipase L1-like esterase